MSDAGGPEAAPGAAVPGPDGRMRCPWAVTTPDYLAYHDDEWGRPVHGDRALFERLSLEAFQSGLSWLTILRKRTAFRAAFAAFEPSAVAAYGPADVERMLSDASIVRNRAKIAATISNARAALALRGGLDAFLWSFAPEPAARQPPATLQRCPPSHPNRPRWRKPCAHRVSASSARRRRTH